MLSPTRRSSNTLSSSSIRRTRVGSLRMNRSHGTTSAMLEDKERNETYLCFGGCYTIFPSSMTDNRPSDDRLQKFFYNQQKKDVVVMYYSRCVHSLKKIVFFHIFYLLLAESRKSYLHLLAGLFKSTLLIIVCDYCNLLLPLNRQSS